MEDVEQFVGGDVEQATGRGKKGRGLAIMLPFVPLTWAFF
jgi:hypothetical protein